MAANLLLNKCCRLSTAALTRLREHGYPPMKKTQERDKGRRPLRTAELICNFATDKHRLADETGRDIAMMMWFSQSIKTPIRVLTTVSCISCPDASLPHCYTALHLFILKNNDVQYVYTNAVMRKCKTCI